MSDEPALDTTERLLQLHRTGAGTDMGKLLRLFWHPVGLSRELKPGKAMAIKVLSEELTLSFDER